jgi:hypothetical protein
MAFEPKLLIEADGRRSSLKIKRSKPKRARECVCVVHHVTPYTRTALRLVDHQIINLEKRAACQRATSAGAHQTHRRSGLERRVQLVTVDVLKERTLKKRARVEVRAKVACKGRKERPL